MLASQLFYLLGTSAGSIALRRYGPAMGRGGVDLLCRVAYAGAVLCIAVACAFSSLGAPAWSVCAA
mgnify:FL=1